MAVTSRAALVVAQVQGAGCFERPDQVQLDVLVVGSVNRDYVCRVEVLPAPGQTVLGGEASVGSGGKGGNQAVAASLLGARTALVARVGDDDDGRAVAADLAAAGGDTAELMARWRWWTRRVRATRAP